MAQVLMFSSPYFRGVITDTPSGTAYNVKPGETVVVASADVGLLVTLGFTAAPGTNGITITDGVNTVANAAMLTVSGGTVGGTTPNATLSITGGGGGSLLVATATISAAALTTLNSAPVTMTMPSPGAGNVAVLIGGIVQATGGPGGSQPSPLNCYINYASDAPGQGGIAAANVSLVGTNGGPMVPTSTSSTPGVDISNQSFRLITDADMGNWGAITSSSITSGNAGLTYAVNDTGTIQTDSGDATYKVLTVDGVTGAVLTYELTGPGTSYETATGAATATGGAQPGSGTGLELDIVVDTPQTGTMTVTIYYTVVPYTAV